MLTPYPAAGLLHLKAAALGGFFAGSCLFTNHAMALDASDFINSLQKSFQEKGNALSFGSMEEDGSGGAVLKDVKLEDSKTGNVITIKNMTLSGTEQIGENGYLFEQMQATVLLMVSKKNDVENTLSIGEMRIDDFSYPDRASGDNPFWPLNMSAGEFTNVRMDGKGEGTILRPVPVCQYWRSEIHRWQDLLHRFP